jgi:hypothetical protein
MVASNGTTAFSFRTMQSDHRTPHTSAPPWIGETVLKLGALSLLCAKALPRDRGEEKLVGAAAAEDACIRRFAGSLQGCTELCLANARCKKAVRRLYCTTNWACYSKHELQLDRFTQVYIHTVVRAKKELDAIRFAFNHIVEHSIKV